MFSIQKFFAKDTRFFDLLEASAEESRSSVQALKAVLAKQGSEYRLDPFVESRRKGKRINGEIAALLARSSVTSLDREDIEAISSVLYKIPKTVEKFAERYLICQPEIRSVDFARHVAFLEQATDTVAAMVRELEKAHFEQVIDHNERLQNAEGQADEMMLDLLKDLYSGKFPPLQVIMLKDLYELLEKVMDRCRDVGNVIANTVLKHS